MAMAAGFERVFEIGPAFRAEPSFTSRHETEFISIDMEVAWIESHADIMDMEERWLAHALKAVAAAHGDEIKRTLDVEITIPTLPFPRLAFADALAMLEGAGAPPPKADDLDSASSAASRRWSPPSAATSFCLSPTFPPRVAPSITCATKIGRP